MGGLRTGDHESSGTLQLSTADLGLMDDMKLSTGALEMARASLESAVDKGVTLQLEPWWTLSHCASKC